VSFCTRCGAETILKIPGGDDRQRQVCPVCNAVAYQNPKIVVGAIPVWEGRILLCRRAIEPRRGFWTLPAGFMENDETLAQGAARETWEEARARLIDMEPYGVYTLTFVNQVYVMFRAQIVDGQFAPGPESLETALVDEKQIPWPQLAFAVIAGTLERYLADRRRGRFPMYMDEISSPQGHAPRYPDTASASGPAAFPPISLKAVSGKKQ